MAFRLQNQARTVTFTSAKGKLFSSTERDNINQVSAKSKGGKFATATFNPAIYKDFTVNFNLFSQSEVDDFRAFWSDPSVLIMGFPVFYKPDDSLATEYTVKKTSPTIDTTRIKADSLWGGSFAAEEII